MAAASTDRNLLFGILAVQLDFVTKDALVAAMSAWLLDKAKPLGDILREHGDLSPERLQLLTALVAEHLRQHGNDSQKSLAALSSVPPTLRQQLAALPDEAVQQSIAHVAVERPATPPPAPDPNQTIAQPPTNQTIAQLSPSAVRYRILRPHAKGGLGEVFVAEDAELGRHVALKEIQNRYADDAMSRDRFVREAEITGGLEHPGIVPVYGLGSYGDGRPFYAMRFIKGDNLKQAIKRFHGEPGTTAPGVLSEKDLRGLWPPARRFDSLDFRQLLRRFIDVCNAIAYAHSRGVLHRDLKPGNIMLGKYGETLVVDWGLAKPTGRAGNDIDRTDEATLMPRSGSDSSSATVAGQAMGTPAYMSPEQAAGKLDELGPAADVYSLGATMYELLTGQVPFPEVDLDAVQEGRFPPPRLVNHKVPPALAAACIKAMALKPEDRYGSALDLAADVEHWLADEPVTAWREPFGPRLRRWVRKHARLVTGVVAALTVGAATLGVAAVLLTAANERERQAADREREAAGREREAKESALAREAETKAVLDFVENKIFAAARPEGQDGGLGREVTLRRAVEAALPFVNTSFRDQPLIEARLRSTLGTSFLYLGDAKRSAEQYEVARALYGRALGPDHPDTLRSMNDLAESYAALGQHADALKLREETLARVKAKLGPDHPYTLASMNNLASTYRDLGRYAEALKLREETLALQKTRLGPDHPVTLASMNNLANSYAALGRPADALKLREKTLALRKAKLGSDHPDTLASMNNLANSYAALGRPADALKLYEETLALRKAKLGPDHPDTLSTMNNVAISYYALGRHADAIKLREETLALQKARLGPDHPGTLGSMTNLANSYAALGRPADALKLREETLALYKAKLGPDHPNTLMSMNNLAASYTALGRHADALKLNEETLALRKTKFGPDHPDTLLSMGNLAGSLDALNRSAEAVPVIDECLKRSTGKVVDPRLIPFVMDLRLRHFKKSKDAAGCRATADMWEKLNRTDADSLYNAACYRAVTAGVAGQTPGTDATRLADAEAQLAVVRLRKALAAGYTDIPHLLSDADLAPLRRRADFADLLWDLADTPAAPVKP